MGQRRAGISGILERVEADDHIEAVIPEWQVFQVACLESALRDTVAGNLEQRVRGINSRHLRAAIRRQRRSHAGSAPGIKIARACPDRCVLKRGNVSGAESTLLQIGPVTRPHTPQTAIGPGRPGRVGCCHLFPPVLRG